MPANVKSIDAIREFRHEIREYQDALRQTMDMLSAELVRAVDYFESDRAAYWPAQVRKASDRLAQAKIDLERCQVTTKPGEGPSCYDEKKALQRAKVRLQYAEQRVRATRKSIRVVLQAVDEFRTRMAQVRHLADTELTRTATVLAKLAQRLERYVSQPTPKP